MKKHSEIEIHGVDEMDFGSIGKTLSKYGKGVPAHDPKTPTRSKIYTDYTMTGHQEKKSSTGRVYTKAPEMDREPEATKATAKPDQTQAPKRGRGRPAGALNKNGSGVTGKGWSDEAKASLKAKLAARKAAKLAAKNESVELGEAAKFKVGDNVFVHMLDVRSKKMKKHAGTIISKSSDAHIVKFHESNHPSGKTVSAYSDELSKMSKNESAEITEEDWADIVEDQSIDAIVEFMMEEEYQSLDELSKKTLGSYIKKASNTASSLATNAMHLKNIANMHADAQRDSEKRGDQMSAVQHDSKSADYHGYSKDATDKQIKRLAGVRKATDRLTKESESLDELSKKTLGSYITKAKSDIKQKNARIRDLDAEADDQEEWGNKSAANSANRKADSLQQRVKSRSSGVRKATDRLANESESLDELSQKTLGSYMRKAEKSANDMGKMQHSHQRAGLKHVEIAKLSDNKRSAARHKSLASKEFEKEASLVSKMHKRDANVAKASKKYWDKPNNESTELDEAKEEYVNKHKEHGVHALRGLGEESIIEYYARSISKNLIKE